MPHEAIEDFKEVIYRFLYIVLIEIKVLKLNSSNVEAKVGIGKAYLQLEDIPNAKKSIEEALEINKTSPEAWEALGTLELQLV